MPIRHKIVTKQYKVTIEELTTIEVRPTYEEENPGAVTDDWKKPVVYREDVWEVTDIVVVTDKDVMAGFLKAKADHFEEKER